MLQRNLKSVQCFDPGRFYIMKLTGQALMLPRRSILLIGESRVTGSSGSGFRDGQEEEEEEEEGR